MINPSWQLIKTMEVPAKPEGLWLLALEYISGPKTFKIEACGSWKYSDKIAPCGPDGDPGSLVDKSQCLFADAPIGALLGKIGGSSASMKEAKVFPVGLFCVVELPSKETENAVKGPLYFSMNDHLAGFADNDGQLTVSIYEAV
jgi:hypothetical protein